MNKIIIASCLMFIVGALVDMVQNGIPGSADRAADAVIENLDQYMAKNGRAPNPTNHALMKQMGFELKAGWVPDYKVLDDGRHYRITLLEGTDGPYWYYESSTAKWQMGFPKDSVPASNNLVPDL